jgi:hypothetical protein
MGLGSEIRDPEKNLFRIPGPGVKEAPDPGSGSATLKNSKKILDFYCFVTMTFIFEE